jgi:hypothetical protein
MSHTMNDVIIDEDEIFLEFRRNYFSVKHMENMIQDDPLIKPWKMKQFHRVTYKLNLY